MIELLVGADDRTGALETAGACADAGFGPVEVTLGIISSPVGRTTRVAVVDLATRHLDPESAGTRAAAMEGVPASRRAHKIDSTLRGNWAHELVARQRAGRGRVLVAPAFPALGRTCVDGVVLEQGWPVRGGPAGDDVRMPVRWSRPADHLRAAGASEVRELGDASEIGPWLASGSGAFVVGDAATDGELVAIGTAWAEHPDVLFAGTSASIGAAWLAMTERGVVTRAAAPSLAAPVLVVCGSLHQVARQQVEALVATGAVSGVPGARLGWASEALGAGRPVVLASPMPDVARVSDREAMAMARTLGAAVRRLAQLSPLGTLVVIGGDVAAEVMGSEPMLVGGTIAPGVAWCRRAHGPLVLTRAGGFGGPTALVDLLSGTLVR